MKHLFSILLLALTSLLVLAQSEADALAFVKQHHPAIHEKIVALKAADPADYESALDDAKKATADFARIQTAGDAVAAAAFLKMYALDFEAITLSDQYLSATTDAERAKLKAQLRAKIAESLDQWIIVERSRVKRLESELSKAKAAVEDAATNRDKVIADDTEALIEESRSYRSTKKSL